MLQIEHEAGLHHTPQLPSSMYNSIHQVTTIMANKIPKILCWLYTHFSVLHGWTLSDFFSEFRWPQQYDVIKGIDIHLERIVHNLNANIQMMRCQRLKTEHFNPSWNLPWPVGLFVCSTEWRFEPSLSNTVVHHNNASNVPASCNQTTNLRLHVVYTTAQSISTLVLLTPLHTTSTIANKTKCRRRQ